MCKCLSSDLLQVEDSSGDPLDTIHHPLRVRGPLAPRHYVLVKVELPPHCRVF